MQVTRFASVLALAVPLAPVDEALALLDRARKDAEERVALEEAAELAERAADLARRSDLGAAARCDAWSARPMRISPTVSASVSTGRSGRCRPRSTR